MRINIILLKGTLWIISKKLILQFSMRLLVYSHMNNIKTFWYYSHNILIRLLRSRKDHRNICYFWRQFIENEWKKQSSVIFELEHSWFSVKFVKFLRTPVFTEHHQWLLLKNGLQRKSEISPVYMTKVTRLQRKKSGKERMTWDGECLWLRQNYKGNLDLLKRCSEKFLQWLFLEKRLFFNLSKENKYLHHCFSTKRKDLINLKWIPPPRTSRESANLENNRHHRNIWHL